MHATKLKDYPFQNYSCVATAIENLTNIVAYHPFKANMFIVLPSFITAFGFIGAVTLCATLTYRAIGIKAMSPQLRRTQKKFLLQVILQTFIPVVIVVIPVIALFGTVWQKVYNTQCKFNEYFRD